MRKLRLRGHYETCGEAGNDGKRLCRGRPGEPNQINSLAPKGSLTNKAKNRLGQHSGQQALQCVFPTDRKCMGGATAARRGASDGRSFRSGSLAMLATIRRASSRGSNLAAERIILILRAPKHRPETARAEAGDLRQSTHNKPP